MVLRGQVLSKKTNIDGDVEWTDPSGGAIVEITETDASNSTKTGYAFASDDRTGKGAIGNKAADFSFYIEFSSGPS